MRLEQLTEKYSNIEDKIPSVWESYDVAATELAQDICTEWNINDSELIRVISLVSMRMAGKGHNVDNIHSDFTAHINPMFAFRGLYPEKMGKFNIKPENIS